jgi:hypothetical protein
MNNKYEHCLRAREVAHILDMSPDDVLELACTGRLKGEKQECWWRFSLAAVETYKKDRELELALQLSSFD